ncbi:hypothetical protein HCU66_20760 [Pseudomonas frederiksbergensis]|uniref:hypothetical protein n=1 Tax=Pseudomonas frederiksbergensis TaxID=104087 RepID=UPI00197D03E9|nr:hypothetical protein [Pseudomonas frederiksbergensis]MBN3864667.1 hypothetical protein [Pseudomonas frederiksbergensis]
MTLLVAINYGNFALIAADKKMVEYADGKIVYSNEEALKIVHTKIGFITGQGSVELLDLVKNRIARSEVVSTDQIVDVIVSERSSLQVNKMDDDSINHWLRCTGWILSYCTVDDLDKPIVRIAQYHPSLHESALAVVDKIRIGFPIGVTLEDSRKWMSEFEGRIGAINKDLSFEAVLGSSIFHISWLMDELSKMTDSVSSCFDIGVLFDNHESYMAENISRASSEFELIKV